MHGTGDVAILTQITSKNFECIGVGCRVGHGLIWIVDRQPLHPSAAPDAEQAWAGVAAAGHVRQNDGTITTSTDVRVTPIAAQLGAKVPGLAYQANPLLAALTLNPDFGKRILALVPGNPWSPVAETLASPLGLTWLPFVGGCLVLLVPLLLLASVALARGSGRD